MTASDFTGQRALVTGGAKGIGAATCRSLAAAGCRVAFCDIDVAAGEKLARDIDADFLALDVTDAEAVSKTLSAAPAFDVVVNNAGIDQHAFFTDLDASDWRHLLSVNLESVFAVTKAVLPAMQKSRYGRIVNVASEAGRLGSKGGSVYAAAKAGVVGFTRSIARENARFGITANAILPGPVLTPLVEAIQASHGEKVMNAMKAMTLVNRLGAPEEIASAIVFLASREASFITGEALGVSGGMGCGAG